MEAFFLIKGCLMSFLNERKIVFENINEKNICFASIPLYKIRHFILRFNLFKQNRKMLCVNITKFFNINELQPKICSFDFIG